MGGCPWRGSERYPWSEVWRGAVWREVWTGRTGAASTGRRKAVPGAQHSSEGVTEDEKEKSRWPLNKL